MHKGFGSPPGGAAGTCCSGDFPVQRRTVEPGRRTQQEPKTREVESINLTQERERPGCGWELSFLLVSV